jgi:surface-adhesin protein E
MTGLVLITLLLLSSGPAYAEWVAVDKNDDGRTVYVDPATIRRNGDLVKMWTLLDYTTVQTVVQGLFLSMRQELQFNCAEKRQQLLASTMFSGNMERGYAVYSDLDEGKWRPVAPRSIGEVLWEFACGKK